MQQTPNPFAQDPKDAPPSKKKLINKLEIHFENIFN
jgi:hypothetical protein